MEKTLLKTSLDHLPEKHQENLATIKEAILQQVQPAMIILFGSYARGDYVEKDYTEEDGITYAYISDYDILVVTEKGLRSEQLRAVKKRIRRKHLLTPTAIIDHSIGSLNEQIRDSHYFFLDLVKEGIMLYDSGDHELASPQRLRPTKKLAKAREHLEYWINKAEKFYDFFRMGLEKKYYTEAAFQLHQAVENCYHAFLLVFTDYKPKTHDLEELRKIAIKIHPAQRQVFAIKNKEDQDRWELLLKSYISARYRQDYVITAEALEYLGEQTRLLLTLTKQLSQEELKGPDAT